MPCPPTTVSLAPLPLGGLTKYCLCGALEPVGSGELYPDGGSTRGRGIDGGGGLETRDLRHPEVQLYSWGRGRPMCPPTVLNPAATVVPDPQVVVAETMVVGPVSIPLSSRRRTWGSSLAGRLGLPWSDPRWSRVPGTSLV